MEANAELNNLILELYYDDLLDDDDVVLLLDGQRHRRNLHLIPFDQSILVYKILNKLCPESFWNMFQLRSSLSNYNARNYKDIHIPMLKLESTKKEFQYAGIKAWNNIPLSIRELSSLSLIKSHLKKHFMSNEN